MSDKRDSVTRCSDLEQISQRVQEKSVSYDRYNFSSRYNDLLKAFFDLCQEFDSLADFNRICIAVPLEMIGIPCALYLVDDKKKELQLVCDSDRGILDPTEAAPSDIHLQSESYETLNSYIVPIYSRTIFHAPPADADSKDWFTLEGFSRQNRIFGMFEVKQLEALSSSDKFFFQKYCNRIGYNLHNRLILIQNIAHLKFINNLVMDIEHNIIVPNMYFKHIFNQLKKKINELDELKKEISQLVMPPDIQERFADGVSHCDAIQQEMILYHQELVKHHANTSLFLESLFRREHFKKGHLVLRTRRCFVEKEVILPQLEHYASRLRAANVSIDRPKNMLEEEFEILVDVGLLSQVYANFFSNAAKYASEVVDHHGKVRKAVAYGRELVENFQEPGKLGIKFNVFTTGPHLDINEAQMLFEEGVRGKGSEKHPGTGHGLAFIKHVVELHGGKVGYEPTQGGNNFYFVLPLPPLMKVPETE